MSIGGELGGLPREAGASGLSAQSGSAGASHSRRGAINSERMRAELARLDEEERAKVPDINGLLATVESLTSIGDAWDVATLEQKREAVRIVFDQVRIDTRAKAVHVVPRETYRPLFGAMAAELCADIPPAGESPSFSTQRIFAVRELVA